MARKQYSLYRIHNAKVEYLGVARAYTPAEALATFTRNLNAQFVAFRKSGPRFSLCGHTATKVQE